MTLFENALQYFGFAFLSLSLLAAVADGIVTLLAKVKQLLSGRSGAHPEGMESAGDPRAWGELVKAIGGVKMWLGLAFVGAALTMVAPFKQAVEAQVQASSANTELVRAQAYEIRTRAEGQAARPR